MLLEAADTCGVLDRTGPFAPEDFEPGDLPKEILRSVKVLVVGAGGLGCELLKNLALSGFTDVHVIDMDTIDVSNLNRQFLFRAGDVGLPKAEVAARAIAARRPGVAITPHFCRIQDKSEAFYASFSLVICGLDSVDARRWINAVIVGLHDPERPESLIPLIDGGTEGLMGQARVILPHATSCYECSLDLHAKRAAFPVCTIANTPRLPEHCIEWASVLEWPRARPELKMDPDDPSHITWLCERAQARAAQFDIKGVTYTLTQGVVKHIIPAIASTNAIIAAACTNEAFKIVTSAAGMLENYMQYSGAQGVYTYTFAHERKPECSVCGTLPTTIELGREAGSSSSTEDKYTLERFIEDLRERPDVKVQTPSLRTETKTLYMAQPPSLEEATRKNLRVPLRELVASGDLVLVTDASLPVCWKIIVRYV